MKQADRGQRAALALEYVGEVIDEEIEKIHAALASPKTTEIEKAVTILQVLVWLKDRLTNEKAVGEESAEKLREES